MRVNTLLKYRRLTQLLFVLFLFLMPVLNILRYDSDARELIILGKVWSLGLKEGLAAAGISGSTYVATHVLLRALLPWVLALSIFPLLGYFLGRFFCGWFCPEGAMFEYVDFLSQRLLGRRSLYGRKPNDPDVMHGNRPLYGILAFFSLLVLPPLAGASLTGYFIAPKTVWGQIVSGHFTFGVKAGIIGVSLYMVITSVFVRHVFCRYICAAGLMQMLFGWVSPRSLRLKMDTARMGECTDCKGCEKACFMDVLPRKNRRDISCVNCGACVAACREELGPGGGLFDLGFGKGVAAPRKNRAEIAARGPVS